MDGNDDHDKNKDRTNKTRCAARSRMVKAVVDCLWTTLLRMLRDKAMSITPYRQSHVAGSHPSGWDLHEHASRFDIIAINQEAVCREAVHAARWRTQEGSRQNGATDEVAAGTQRGC
jgi:hypothetical protein